MEATPMMIRLSDGFIGFEGREGDQGSVSHFWKPTQTDLVEFGEDAIFWSTVEATKHASGFSYRQIWTPQTARLQRGGTVGS
jgi:hypothetical protein